MTILLYEEETTMNAARRFHLFLALLSGLLLLAIPLPPVTGQAQHTDWTPVRVDFSDGESIRVIGLDADTGVTVSPAVDAYAAEHDKWIYAGAPSCSVYWDSSATQSFDIAWHVTGEWITIFSDDFEGAFPGEWDVFDHDGDSNGEYFWWKRDCRPHTGGYSAWAVGAGADGSGLPCGSDYPDHADSAMIYGIKVKVAR
jgi:hypothetical protein